MAMNSKTRWIKSFKRSKAPKGYKIQYRKLRRFGKGKRHYYWFAKLKEKVRPIKKMWRLTLAVNYSLHHHYFSYVIQAWNINKSKLVKMMPELKKKLIAAVEKLIGYEQSEWWFPQEPSMELEEVELKKKLNNKIEIRQEDLGIKRKRKRK